MFKEKHVTVFPTYGFRTGEGWTVQVRVWVHKQRSLDHLSDDHIRTLLWTTRSGRRVERQDRTVCR